MNKQRKSVTRLVRPQDHKRAQPLGQQQSQPQDQSQGYPDGPSDAKPKDLDFGWFKVSKDDAKSDHPEGSVTGECHDPSTNGDQPLCPNEAGQSYERINDNGIIHVAPPPVTYDNNDIVMDWPISNVGMEQMRQLQTVEQAGSRIGYQGRPMGEKKNPPRCESRAVRAIPATPMPPLSWQGYSSAKETRPTYATWRENWHNRQQNMGSRAHKNNNYNNNNNHDDENDQINITNDCNNNNNSIHNPGFDGELSYTSEESDNIIMNNISVGHSSISNTSDNDYYNTNNHLNFTEYNLATADVDMFCSVQPFFRGIECLNKAEGTSSKRCDSPGRDCLRDFPMTMKEEESDCPKPEQSRQGDTIPIPSPKFSVRNIVQSFVHWPGWSKLKNKTRMGKSNYSKLGNDRQT